jgi:hypothetical protein
MVPFIGMKTLHRLFGQNDAKRIANYLDLELNHVLPFYCY